VMVPTQARGARLVCAQIANNTIGRDPADQPEAQVGAPLAIFSRRRLRSDCSIACRATRGHSGFQRRDIRHMRKQRADWGLVTTPGSWLGSPAGVSPVTALSCRGGETGSREPGSVGGRVPRVNALGGICDILQPPSRSTVRRAARSDRIGTRNCRRRSYTRRASSAW